MSVTDAFHESRTFPFETAGRIRKLTTPREQTRTETYRMKKKAENRRNDMRDIESTTDVDELVIITLMNSVDCIWTQKR